MGNVAAHVARPLRILHRDGLSAGDRRGRHPKRVDRDRLPQPDPSPARARRKRRGQALGPQRHGAVMSEHITTETPPPRRGFLMALPLILFAGLAALFWFRLGAGDPSKIPSALIGHAAPQTARPPLTDLVSEAAPVPDLYPPLSQSNGA